MPPVFITLKSPRNFFFRTLIFILGAGFICSLSRITFGFQMGIESEIVTQALFSCQAICQSKYPTDPNSEIKCMVGTIQGCTSPYTVENQIKAFSILKPQLHRMYLWVFLTEGPETLNERLYSLYKNTVHLLIENGIQVTAVSHDLPSWVTGTPSNTPQFEKKIPCRFEANGKDNPAYLNFLSRVSAYYQLLGRSFPEIRIWESGNETNGIFLLPQAGKCPLTPEGKKTTTSTQEFTYEEKAALTVDLMYYVKNALQSVQPDVLVFSPGFAPWGPGPKSSSPSYSNIQGIAEFLKLIYKQMKSNKFPTGQAAKTTKSTDYMSGLAWHPYCDMNSPNSVIGKKNIYSRCRPSDFIDHNNLIFKVIKKNNDQDLPIYISEFGLRDYREGNYDSKGKGWNDLGIGPWTKAKCRSRGENAGWNVPKDKWGVAWSLLTVNECQKKQNENINNLQFILSAFQSKLNFKASYLSYYKAFDLAVNDGYQGWADAGTSTRGLLQEPDENGSFALKPLTKAYLEFLNSLDVKKN